MPYQVSLQRSERVIRLFLQCDLQEGNKGCFDSCIEKSLITEDVGAASPVTHNYWTKTKLF